ncbi:MULTISPECIES: methionyl-tRNA formyltransferase [unclassified Sporosarcina]|uniref:methionyl-tRNA formyltransferase n=1 Tax=unclassified Sporosarcina TaxID=2647733 RepID=UPI002040F4D1|nr:MULTISPECIES: methionyl-tRNA formyltransferase [unclassified Sporosarcina]GKV64853.1 hypothetical protein NCCP2331_10060 [Sporosarcina sp. NCCP-2331]GLB54963.1 hypothetical protein NCCP2378_07480 [Sporosarcina sp. NCCP-2378]
MKVVIAFDKSFYRDTFLKLKEIYLDFEFYYFENNSMLNLPLLESINPKFIFFPHWSTIIPKEIYENFNCIIFHMTDLPYGRGGSPLQNLIARGIYETKISAIKCVETLDAGPIYTKVPFSLHGNAEEIYLRAAEKIQGMIEYILNNEPEPIEQSGQIIEFKRRNPLESDLSGLSSLHAVFDYIRMLDADGYPKAFIEVGDFRYEFTRASRKANEVIADVKIKLKRTEEI